MILKSFVLGNRLSLCMKILNSVVVVGLYYGLLITLSIGPSYLFLLRALVVMEKGDKGIDLIVKDLLLDNSWVEPRGGNYTSSH